MARRNDNTREELKEMAVEAGISLLGEGGIQALSARSIAQRIGYTVGTLYNVFDDLEDIILHINAATVRDMYEALAPLAKGKKQPLTRILAFAHGYGAYALAHPARWNLLHSSVRTTPIPAWYREEIHRIFSMVEQTLTGMAAFPASTAHDATHILWAGLRGICALSISQKLDHVEAQPMHALIDNFVTHYLQGHLHANGKLSS